MCDVTLSGTRLVALKKYTLLLSFLLGGLKEKFKTILHHAHIIDRDWTTGPPCVNGCNTPRYDFALANIFVKTVLRLYFNCF